MVEFELIGGEKLAGPEGISRASEAAQFARQFGARGFEVALEADIHLLLAGEALGVDYARANLFQFLQRRQSFSIATALTDQGPQQVPPLQRRLEQSAQALGPGGIELVEKATGNG